MPDLPRRDRAGCNQAEPTRGVIPIRAISAVLATVALGVVTYEVVTHGSLTELDMAVMAWADAHSGAAGTTVLQWISASGGPSITSAYAAILIIPWLMRRELATAVGVATIVYGSAGLNVALKHLVQRQRPILESPLMQLPTYSFPSGHAVASTVFGGLMILLVLRDRTQERPNVLAIGAFVLWIVLVCASRIYLGAHYPTDVLAGVLEGIAWLMCSTLALDRWQVPLNWPKPALT